MSWGVRMQYKTIGEINHYASENVNPARFPEQYFELYSVPHFSEGYPEIIKGKDVGATKQVVQEGDVLICKINPRINRVWKVTRHTDYPLIASSEWVIVRNADLNADYLTYYFSSPKFRVLINSELTGMGGSLTRAQPKQIRRYSVPVPDKEEQHFVVRNLALLDHLISLRQRQAEKLDELVKARFVEMFGDPVLNCLHTAARPMTEICQIIDGDRGKNYPKADDFFDKGDCLFLNAKNVTKAGFNFDECMFITKDKDNVLRKGKLQRGDIILTTRGTIGNLAFYTDDVPYSDIRINSGMVILRMNREYINPIYFIEQFKMQLENIKRKIASGTAQPQLPISTMNKIKIIIPDIRLQANFANFVHEVDREKERIQRSAALLETLKRSLMQQYFG